LNKRIFQSANELEGFTTMGATLIRTHLLGYKDDSPFFLLLLRRCDDALYSERSTALLMASTDASECNFTFASLLWSIP
jgi:hypothetical protein